ncbi:MAG: hypothetical protein ABR99_10020 [Rhodobacter sp. BACL10 MAG-121220-bin24]|nr:MAG: hypothetical protein ABR99_10020 [Rhodobacter sp. BACL10 MAG-121220-bin24]
MSHLLEWVPLRFICSSNDIFTAPTWLKLLELGIVKFENPSSVVQLLGLDLRVLQEQLKSPI